MEFLQKHMFLALFLADQPMGGLLVIWIMGG
jgi:hypothetical protein